MATQLQETSAVQDLIQQEQVLAQAKQNAIKALLKEQVDLAKATKTRLTEIASELKSLGWHRTRNAKAAKASSPSAT